MSLHLATGMTARLARGAGEGHGDIERRVGWGACWVGLVIISSLRPIERLTISTGATLGSDGSAWESLWAVKTESVSLTFLPRGREKRAGRKALRSRWQIHASSYTIGNAPRERFSNHAVLPTLVLRAATAFARVRKNTGWFRIIRRFGLSWRHRRPENRRRSPKRRVERSHCRGSAKAPRHHRTRHSPGNIPSTHRARSRPDFYAVNPPWPRYYRAFAICARETSLSSSNNRYLYGIVRRDFRFRYIYVLPNILCTVIAKLEEKISVIEK